ncbi:MAG: SMC-Scp complex subunit ScpB [Candidatus Omnitrophota bacterium]|nr:MAG: SMC-Scp complex subunit ScpB [Candidatus Omnitrophota bacterium]
MSENNIKAVIEALLFASEKPLTLEQIRGILDNLSNEEIRVNLDQLKQDYEELNRGIRLIEVAGGFRLVTAPVFVSFLKKLYKQRQVEKLSRPALETLAIIAYKQPVTRFQIETIRRVNVDGIMKTLMDRGLLRVTGRKKAPGRPKVYGTSRQFLEYFGLKSLEELPKVEDFLKEQLKNENNKEGLQLQPQAINEEVGGNEGNTEAAQSD